VTTLAEAIEAQRVRALRAFGLPATELEQLVVDQARDMRYRYSILPDTDHECEVLPEDYHLDAGDEWADPTFEEVWRGIQAHAEH